MSTGSDTPSTAYASPHQRNVVTPLVRMWLPIVIVVGSITILASRQARPITDPDLWWHLRLGQEFRDGWALADPGALSPFATEHWVPTQWSLEILASYLVDRVGLAGVVWLTGLGVALLGVALWLGNRVVADPLPAAIATAAALAGTTPVLAPRPQVASLVFLAVTATAWWRSSRDLRPRWWLIPLTWVWACTHGFWVVGILLGFTVVAGLALDRRLTTSGMVRLAVVPLASLGAAAATPVGPALLRSPFQVRRVSGFIVEWQPPDFTSPAVLVTATMAAAIVLRFARRAATTWTEIAVFLLGAGLLVYSLRTVALAAVVFSTLAASAVQAWTGRDANPPSRRERIAFSAGMVGAVAVLTAATILRSPYSTPYPEPIDEALGGLPDGSVVLNLYGYGGWLAWAHPDLTHVIDGLTEVYSPAFLQQYFDALALSPTWTSFVDEVTAADAAFLPAGHPLAWELATDWGWETLADSSGYVVLGRPAG